MLAKPQSTFIELTRSLTHQLTHHAHKILAVLLNGLLQSLASAPAALSQQDFREHWRNTAQYYFGSSSQQLHQSGGRGVSVHPSQAARQRPTGSSGAAAREPRPYYYRVQQQMQAGMANQSQRRLGFLPAEAPAPLPLSSHPTPIHPCFHTGLTRAKWKQV